MKLLIKQLTKELFKNKIFIVLLLLLTVFTSCMFFFVQFSVDGNMLWLDKLPQLNENQLSYRNGLISNSKLALNVLATLTVLTGFVFVMYYFRFFKAEGKQLGCLKALGYKDAALRGFFVSFTAILSLLGEIIGLAAGYFASDILIESGMQSYLVTGLVKSLSTGSLCIGLFAPAIIFCSLTLLTYFMIHGRETGILISGADNTRSYSFTLRLANKISEMFSEKNRLSIRLALRKPITVLLIFISVMTFSVMFIMGYSLTLSSPKVFESQTQGHHYLFDTHFDTPQHSDSADSGILPYLDTAGTIDGIKRTIAGLEYNPKLLELYDEKGNAVALPSEGEVVIGVELQDMYDFQIGDQVTVALGKNQYQMTVANISFNAKSNWIYLSKEELTKLLSLPPDSYTGILSMEGGFEEGFVITNEQKLDALQRGTVSNKSSAIINQAIGCIVGCILLYLALLLNFQDSTRDVLILQLLGYKMKSIKKMLIDIYKPVLWLSFFLTLWPSILLVKAILKSLSLQIGDYMPFQTNFFVIGGIFVLLNALYYVVLATFNSNIKRLIRKESIFNQDT